MSFLSRAGKQRGANGGGSAASSTDNLPANAQQGSIASITFSNTEQMKQYDLALSFTKTSLLAVVESSVVSRLQAKYVKNDHFGRIGSDVYVFVSPRCDPSQVAQLSEETGEIYSERAKDVWSDEKLTIDVKAGAAGFGSGSSLPPHIFELAGNAYYLMLQDQEDQAVVFL
jgi:myosin heavy subunit